MSEAYEPPGSGLAHLDAISRFENARSIERVAQQRLADAHLSQDEGERRQLIKRARETRPSARQHRSGCEALRTCR